MTREQITAAINRACDDVLDAVGAPDEGMRDAINLVANAALVYVDHPSATLDEVVALNYDDDVSLAQVIDWCQR